MDDVVPGELCAIGLMREAVQHEIADQPRRVMAAPGKQSVAVGVLHDAGGDHQRHRANHLPRTHARQRAAVVVVQ